eukprot:COSAG01_NODE_2659_length_7299_cov_34.861111_8_plen_84_part_00
MDDDRKLLCAAMAMGTTATEMFRVFTHGERAVPGEKPQAAARTGGLAGHAGSSRPSAVIGYQDWLSGLTNITDAREVGLAIAA